MKIDKFKMNLQFYIEKLESSEIFKKFKSKNPKAYLSSAFFNLDLINNLTEIQLDYFLPTQNKFTIFKLNKQIIKQTQSAFSSSKPEPINNSNLDINQLPKICQNLLQANKINEKLIKIIAILNSQNNLSIFNLNLITSSMGVIKVKLNDEAKCLSFEKLNLFDFIKKQK